MKQSYKRKLKIIKQMLIKIRNNIVHIIIKHPKIENPKLFMTILAKNEEDIIEENIKFHKAMGVDGFIVTDNNSTDNTRKIFQKYKDLGWIKEIIDEKGNDYSQVEWVDRMIKIAKEKYNADWIINADADEFWYTKDKDLKKILSNSRANKIKCNIYNMIPSHEGKFYNNLYMVKKYITNLEKFKLSKFNMYTKQIPKVIHRSDGYKKIHMGNHDVDMKLSSEKMSKDIIIFHYSIKNIDHFKKKMINGGEAFENNTKLGKDVGGHWRYYYQGWKNGTLDLAEEYKKSIGLQYIDIFKKEGIIEENDSVKKILKSMEE